MKFARIEKNRVCEVIDLPDGTQPAHVFHASLDVREAPAGCAEGWVVYGGVIVSADDLAVVHDLVDQAAGAARARYITVAPGQEATYMLKAADAASYKAAGYTGTVPPFVQAESDAVGCSAADAADSILAQQAAWIEKAVQIEAARRSWKLTLASSEDRQRDVVEAVAELNEF